MLPDRVCQLLTAFVDGELSDRQREQVARVLEQSGEARAFLEQLQHDAGLVRDLPRVRPAEDLAPKVLHAIGARRLATAGPWARLAKSPTYSAWAALAAAAAVLLVVTLSTYFYFASSQVPPERQTVAKK